MIEVELPDGRVVEIETNDPQIAARAARRFLGNEQPGLSSKLVDTAKQAIGGFNAAPLIKQLVSEPIRRLSGRGPEAMYGGQPQGPVERVARAGGEMLGASVPAMAGLAGLAAAGVSAPAQGATTAQRVAGSILDAQRATPALAAEVGGAAGAGVGGQIAEEVAPGNRLARMGGEIVGGVAAPLAPSMTGASLARRAIRTAMAPFSEAATTKRSADFVRARLEGDLSSDIAKQGMTRAQELALEIEGFKPSLAQQTRVPGLVATQRDYEKRMSGPELNEAMARHAGNQQAVQAYAAKSAPEGAASPDAAIEPLVRGREQAGQALRRAETERARLPEAASLIQRKFDADRADIAAGLNRIDRASIGARMRGNVQDARSAAAARLSKMSADLGLEAADVTIPFRGFAKRVKSTVGPKGIFDDPGQLPSVYGLIEQIGKSGVKVTFQDVKGLRERVGRELRDAASGANPDRQAIRKLAMLREAIDEDLLTPDLFDPNYAFNDAATVQRAAGFANNPDFSVLVQAMKGEKKPKAQRLYRFIIANGGLREEGGELAARDLGKIKKLRGIVSTRGQDLDSAAQRAWEAGYLDDSDLPGGGRPTGDDLLMALDDDISGRVPRYPRGTEADANDAEMYNRSVEELSEVLDDLGIDASGTPGRIKAQINGLAEQFRSTEQLGRLQQGYSKFRNAYFNDLIKPFETGAAYEIRRKDGTGFFRTPDEGVAAEFFGPGQQTTARQYQQLFGSKPKAMGDMVAVALDSLADAAVRDGLIEPKAVEAWFRRHDSAINEMPAVKDALQPIANALNAARQGRDTAEAGLTQRQEQLERGIGALSERMGLLGERKMALEDAMLSRKVAGIERGAATPEAVISEALQKPRLMLSLREKLGAESEAFSALRRHVWDQAAGLDAKGLQNFIDQSEPALKMVFDPAHLNRLRTILSAREMLESVSPPTAGQAMQSDPLQRIKDMTGANPSAITARMIAVNRGRSSRVVESVVGFSNWYAQRSKASFEALMKRALYDPEVAKAIMDSVDLPTAKAPRKVIQSWMLQSGIARPVEDMFTSSDSSSPRRPAMN